MVYVNAFETTLYGANKKPKQAVVIELEGKSHYTSFTLSVEDAKTLKKSLKAALKEVE